MTFNVNNERQRDERLRRFKPLTLIETETMTEKKTKNVDTFGFVQLYTMIISQHCLRYFKSRDFSVKI